MKKILIILLSLFIISSCSTYRQSVQVDEKSYLLLIGEHRGNVIIIDDGKPINIDDETVSFDLNGKTATKIQISTGSHTLKIMKNGTLTVNRKFYVSAGKSFEVQL
ncbi:MAG: hypothetical protein ACC657_16240 [Thiohalomonadales bacterium]